MTIRPNILRNIAWQVRRRCEKFAKRRDNYFGDDLEGLCAIASCIIHKLLERKGIDSKMVYGQYHTNEDCTGFGHCWVECGDQVIDVTATQFDLLPKVIVRRIDCKRWRWEKIIEDPDTFNWRGWDCEQVPRPKRIERVAGDLI